MADVIRNEGEGMVTLAVHDMGLAAALLSLGHELITMQIDEDCGCAVFHFDFSSLAEKDAEAYYSGKLSVDAQQYWEAHEFLLEGLYGEQHDKD